MDIEAFDDGRHAEMHALLGPEGTRGALRDLLAEAEAAFGAGGDWAGEAHALGSQADVLGFVGLSGACRALARTLRAGAAAEAGLARAREAAEAACRRIEAMTGA